MTENTSAFSCSDTLWECSRTFGALPKSCHAFFQLHHFLKGYISSPSINISIKQQIIVVFSRPNFLPFQHSTSTTTGLSLNWSVSTSCLLWNQICLPRMMSSFFLTNNPNSIHSLHSSTIYTFFMFSLTTPFFTTYYLCRNFLIYTELFLSVR